MECHNCPCGKLVQAFAEADLDRNMGRCQSKRLKEACKKLQEAMQQVCLTCVDEVNDNNPSNHGQTFFSLDSGHCQSNSGKSATSHSDNNEVISRADWINSHASYDSSYYQDNSFRPYSGRSHLDSSFAALRRAQRHSGGRRIPDGLPAPVATYEQSEASINPSAFFDADDGDSANPFQDEYSITTLPSAVEAIILRELNNFAALPDLHKMLICCLLAGRNISEFARMGWLPKEIKKMLKPRAKDAPDVVSAQTAHAIYQNICKKLPYMTVLARATKKRSKTRIETQARAIRELQAANSKKLDYLSSPAKLRSMGKPTSNPHDIEPSAAPSRARRAQAAASRTTKKPRRETSATKYKQEAFL